MRMLSCKKSLYTPSAALTSVAAGKLLYSASAVHHDQDGGNGISSTVSVHILDESTVSC